MANVAAMLLTEAAMKVKQRQIDIGWLDDGGGFTRGPSKLKRGC